jgi:hypothetical protein
MNEFASKRQPLPLLLVGFLIILAASCCTSGAIMRPMRDASGRPILVEGFDYPQQEIDPAATLRANLPAYLCALVGMGFIARATVIWLKKDGNESL